MIARTKYHDRILSFESQLENEPDLLAQHTSNYGVDDSVAYTVTSGPHRVRCVLYAKETVVTLSTKNADATIRCEHNKVVDAINSCIWFCAKST